MKPVAMMRALLLALGVVCATGGPTIAVVGSVNVDITMQVQRLPHQHETLMASAPKVDLALGGKGANQAVAAARLGAAVRFVGRLGRDAHGDWLKKILKSNGVDIAGCSHSQELPSGQGMVMLDAEGGASSVVVGGANMDWASFSAPTLEETLRGASVLLLQQEIPEKINVAAAEVAKAQGVTVIQDVGGEDRPISAQLLPLIDFLCPNENELQRLTGMPVATRPQAETLEVAPFAVPSVVDGTAAGDAFRAALAVAIGEKQSLQNGLRLASAAGALAVSRKGAEPSLPHRKDCEALLGGSSVEQVLAAQTVQSLQGSCEKSWAFASRLNSMKERLDLWNGSTDTLGLIERQGQVKGLGLVYLNFPQHLEGLQPQEMLKALDKAGLKAGGIALRFPEHMRLGALTNPSRELRQEAVELTKSACRWAESLGTEEVVVWPQTDGYDYQLQVDYLSAWSRAVEAFREVLDSSACRQKKVSLEFKPTDEISRFALVPSTGAALLFLRDVDRENFGLTLDVGHLLMAGENPAQSVAMAGAAGKLFGIHLNDGHPRLGAEDGLAFASVHRVAALEVVLWLRRVNYTGSIYFDTFPKNEDPVREAELNVRRFEELWEQTGKMDEEIKTMQEQHDAMGVLEFLDSLA